MTLGEFHQLVSDSLRRGTAQDTQIPGQAKLAVQWLERNYTMSYMENFRLLQVVAGDRTIQLPREKIVKSIKFLRLVGTDGRYSPLKMVDPSDLTGIRNAQNSSSSSLVPKAFWRSGHNLLVLDSVSDVGVSGEAILYEYSDWPTAPDSRHPLLDFAADVLLQQTLLFMAALLRDASMLGAYKALRDEALNTLTRAEDEGNYGGQSFSMAFSP